MAITFINSPKEIKILLINANVENTAIVLDDDNIKQVNPNYERRHGYYERNREKLSQYYHDHYLLNRKEILEKKKEYNKIPEVKQHNSEYHKAYYEANRESLLLNNKERYYRNRNRNRKNNK
jgi:hypothetical protein